MDDFIEIYDSGVQAIIALRGAELVSLKRTGADAVLWEKDAVFWNRTAPNLFPVVGRLLNDSFEFGGEQFNMTQHKSGLKAQFAD